MRKGHLVVLLPDQVPDYQSGGAVAPFFEQDAFNMLLAQRLLQKSKAKVLMASAVRSLDSNGIAYHLMFCEAEPGILADDPSSRSSAECEFRKAYRCVSATISVVLQTF